MTTATVLPFFGGELASFDPFDSNCAEHTGNISVLGGLSFDPAFSRCSIRIVGDASGGASPTWAAAPTFWFRIYTGAAPIGVNGIPNFQFLASGVEVMRCSLNYNNGNGHIFYVFYTRVSGVLVEQGSFEVAGGYLNFVDVGVRAGADGGIEVYCGGTEKFTVEDGLDHSDWAGVTQVYLRGSYNQAFHSQIICDTVSHIGDNVKTFDLDTDSAVNLGFTGGHADINEIATSDSTFASAASADLVSTYLDTGLSLNDYVLAIGVSVRANRGAGGPQNMQVALRTPDGSNHFGPTIGQTVGKQANAKSWTTNPHTGLPWDKADAALVEGGQKSIT